MKKLVICGDSYGYGIGCTNLETQPFGVLTAKHFGWDLIRLARGSASNYTIYLQGMYAADMKDPPHLVVLNQTSYDRIEWFAEGTNPIADHTALNINYHQYPPIIIFNRITIKKWITIFRVIQNIFQLYYRSKSAV
jgi:hypothetical protein